MRHIFKDFTQAEDGNVTVDWVVLLGGMVFLSIAVTASIASSADTVAESTSETMDEAAPTDYVS